MRHDPWLIGKGGFIEGPPGIRNYWLGVHRALLPFPRRRRRWLRCVACGIRDEPKHLDAREYRSAWSIKIPRPAVMLLLLLLLLRPKIKPIDIRIYIYCSSFEISNDLFIGKLLEENEWFGVAEERS